MIKNIMNYLLGVRGRQRISIALAKGGAMMAARSIDLTRPDTWEFSGFSQNGEDGILDVLRKQLLSSNRYFVEIGTSDGIENNSAWLLIAENYNGLMIEGDPKLVAQSKKIVLGYSIGSECHNMFVTKDSILELKALVTHYDPDVFSLDIDGNDYYITQAILDEGIRPKIFVVEYNSVYGPERSMTIEYSENFVFTKAHPSHLYYGVSIMGWRKLFESYGYQFVTVDRNGVNGFFIDPNHFDEEFVNGISGLDFAENQAQYKKYKMPSEEQFKLISQEEYLYI